MPKRDGIAGREITRLSNCIRRELEHCVASCDYSGAEGRAMHYLLTHADDEVYQKDIEAAYGLRPATASQLMKRMETDGLIVRQPSNSDARLKRIIPTAKTMAYRQRMINDLDAIEAKLVDGIDPEDLKAFFRVVQRMRDNLT